MAQRDLRAELGLTDKQFKFCLEYLKDFNGTSARERAGYSGSRETQAVEASKLLKNPKIQACLAELRKQVGDRAEVSLERTLREISRLAFSNVTNTLTFTSSGVTFKDSDELPEEVTAAIESVSSSAITRTFGDTSETNVTLKLKMHNKVAALNLLADFFGIKDDFNKARATLKRYGLLLLTDEDAPSGWRVERVSDSPDPTD